MTPQHLHAIANLWSLHAIWPELVIAARNAAAAEDDRGAPQSWRPSTGGHGSGHGDVVLGAVLRGSSTRGNPYADRMARADDTLAWLTQQLGLTLTVADRVLGLIEAVPGMRPSTALDVARWAEDEDRAARRLLGEGDDHAPITGLPCPSCNNRTLAIRGSNPDSAARPVICEASCPCTGPACSCGAGAAGGALPHIWTQQQIAHDLDLKEAA